LAAGDAPSVALSIQGLTKTYRVPGLRRRRGTRALDGVSLEVQRGEVFGYLGPNGSGKTTTLKLLFGFIAPDEGQWTVLGVPHTEQSWRYRVGFLPESPYFYDYLTAREYLDYSGALLGLGRAVRRDRATALLDRVGLSHSAHMPLRRFSKGMLQRLGLAQALINEPELVLLDEPMSGLDPLGRRLVRDVILGLKEAGKTVFFSTHILPDAEALCDRVAVLKGGQLLSVGRLSEILRVDASTVEVLVATAGGASLEGLSVPTAGRQSLGERTRFEVAEKDLGALLRELDARGARLLSVQPVRRSLEDFFFRQIGAEGQWLVED
jgi:ABC-2 type transport system ATP-binding protein